jgi:protein phosphatase
MSAVSIPDAVAIAIAGQCDRGMVREENQDTVRHVSTLLGDLLIVADGMGGYPGGGVASRMAVDTISSSIEGMPAYFPPEIAVEEASCRANAAIAAAAAEPDSPHSHMGSTVVVALLRAESDRARAPVLALIGHVGDSRAYLVHNQRLTRLTRDHSAVQELIDSNLITPEQAEEHPDASMLTRCLGHEPNVQIHLREVPLEVGDMLMLCSDGLWGYVPEPEIERVLADRTLNVEAASRALLDLALAAGGHDNVGIQLARVGVPGIQAVPRISSPVSAPRFAPQPREAVPAFQSAPPPPLRKPVSPSAAAPKLAPAPLETVPVVASEPIPAPLPAPPPSPVPAYKTAPPPVTMHVPVIHLASTNKTNPARYADSMMLPELIIVPRIEPMSASQSPVVFTRQSVSSQIGIARIAVIFFLAFAASSTLAYIAIINNWLGILHSAR